MSKYAYLREDGRYDLFDVEPKTVTAAEYADMKKREELEARKEQLLVERAAIDAELAKVASQLSGLSTTAAEPAAELVTGSTNQPVELTARRKW